MALVLLLLVNFVADIYLRGYCTHVPENEDDLVEVESEMISNREAKMAEIRMKHEKEMEMNVIEEQEKQPLVPQA